MSLRDAALHVPLGIAFAGIAAVTMLLPWPLSAFAIAAEMIFLREVSQIQEDINSSSCKICTGWNFLTWGTGKNIETWGPIMALVIIGLIIA